MSYKRIDKTKSVKKKSTTKSQTVKRKSFAKFSESQWTSITKYLSDFVKKENEKIKLENIRALGEFNRYVYDALKVQIAEYEGEHFDIVFGGMTYFGINRNGTGGYAVAFSSEESAGWTEEFYFKTENVMEVKSALKRFKELRKRAYYRR